MTELPAPTGQEILAAWIGKEELRDVLNLRARITGSVPCERDVRGRLASFYDWCAQNDDIPELFNFEEPVYSPATSSTSEKLTMYREDDRHAGGRSRNH